MVQISKEKAVQLLCEELGVVEGSNFMVTCDRVLSGWLIQQIVDEPYNHLGLRPWVVSDGGLVATIPFGSNATDVLRTLGTSGV